MPFVIPYDSTHVQTRRHDKKLRKVPRDPYMPVHLNRFEAGHFANHLSHRPITIQMTVEYYFVGSEKARQLWSGAHFSVWSTVLTNSNQESGGSTNRLDCCVVYGEAFIPATSVSPRWSG